MKENHDKAQAFAAQQKLSIIQLLWEIPNYLWLIISALLSKSILVWMDLIDSTNIIVRAIFVVVLSGKLKKNSSYQYNYGTGKVEALASLCCDILLLGSLVVASGFAIRDMLHPSRPSELLVVVLLMKIENIIFDAYILVKQQKNWVDSSMYRSERASNVKNMLFDASMLLVLLISYLGRDLQWIWSISPILSIGFALVFIYYALLRMRTAVAELMDTTCDEQTQRNILKVLAELYDHYDEFIEVKSRKNSNQLLIDIYLHFRPETTYAQIYQFTQTASEKLRELEPNSVVSVVIKLDLYD